MSELVRRANYAVFQHLRDEGLHVVRSHLGEIHAALLGYPTYAALALEARGASTGAHLCDAQVIALDQKAGEARAAELLSSLPPARRQDVIEQCSLALAECAAPITVFESVDDLFDDWAKDQIASLALDAEDLNPAVRMVLGEPVVEGTWRASGSLWHSRLDWVIEAYGTVREIDDDGVSVDGGVVLGWRGRLVFTKAGRAGLIVDTGGASCRPLDADQESDREWYAMDGCD